MEIIASTCLDGGCPTVYSVMDPDHLLIKGYTVVLEDCAEGEQVVRVPKEMILEAAAAVSQNA